jgi:hypothetical protein
MAEAPASSRSIQCFCEQLDQRLVGEFEAMHK